MSSIQAWEDLGFGYPDAGDEDEVVRAAFDVLAPRVEKARMRAPVYEQGHEQTPTPEEVWVLAAKVARAVEIAAGFGKGA